jgi:hypothetical protein
LTRPSVALRAIGWGDVLWLVGHGLDPRKVGEQYHWFEAPLQLYIAPARALLGVRRPACVIERDGRRAGYVGPNPLSGNLEYFLAPWARGDGAGRAAITAYLLGHRAGDRPRRFHVSYGNERSKRALLAAMAAAGWRQGIDYRVDEGRHGWEVHELRAR